MGKWIFRLLILLMLVGGTIAALVIREENGYVLLQFGRYQAETSVVLLIAAVLATFFLLYILTQFLLGVLRTPKKLHDFAEVRAEKRSRRELVSGLLEMSEGHWDVAEKRLTKHASDSQTPLLNYLTAARAAQLQGDDARRDQYLLAAQETTPKAELAVLMTKAELHLEKGNDEQALATLQSLQEKRPNHPFALRHLAALYEKRGDYTLLQGLIPQLKKLKIIDAEQADTLEASGYLHGIQQANANGDASEPARAALAQAWKNVPSKLRQKPELVKVYAHELHRAGAGDSAASLIEGFLKRQWSDELADLYGRLRTENPSRQLSTAEGWLRSHDDSAALLLTLGRLSMRSELWGKARSYLEASISAAPRPDTYQELGLLLQSLEEPEKASLAFRSGLALAHDRMVLTEAAVSDAAPAALPAPAVATKKIDAAEAKPLPTEAVA